VSWVVVARFASVAADALRVNHPVTERVIAGGNCGLPPLFMFVFWPAEDLAAAGFFYGWRHSIHIVVVGVLSNDRAHAEETLVRLAVASNGGGADPNPLDRQMIILGSCSPRPGPALSLPTLALDEPMYTACLSCYPGPFSHPHL
jgi:hypothetical protein